jgi:disulfide bond formation protein DsbB
LAAFFAVGKPNKVAQSGSMTARVDERIPGQLSSAAAAAIFAGSTSLILLGGALAFQYLGGLAPCEMCLWQRWPHGVAVAAGLLGGLLVATDTLPADWARFLAVIAIAGLAVSGALGVFHAGVEWKFWPGPAQCTGFGYVPGQAEFKPLQIVRCDEAQWRLLGISLAGYNAVFSFGAAAIAALILRSKKRRST